MNKVNNARDMSPGSGQYPVKDEPFRASARSMLSSRPREVKKKKREENNELKLRPPR